jgi:hypothetical protein
MANFNGTTLTAGKSGELGSQNVCTGKFTIATALANTDTITFPVDLLPIKGKIIGGRIYGAAIDSHGSPTATFTLGTAADPDGFVTTRSGATGLTAGWDFNGDLKGTVVSQTAIILTVTAAVATGATSGTLFVDVIVEGV